MNVSELWWLFQLTIKKKNEDLVVDPSINVNGSTNNQYRYNQFHLNGIYLLYMKVGLN